jgi:hypothetical protein
MRNPVDERSADRFSEMEGFSMLGTGKLDLRKVKEMAERAG